ncbi:DNA methyltransferase [Fontisphaera persica]|uniref:DNA methyltransferase n=1 Tax=Fontisphaera persica TaxID=2974023 RepID=UPI003CCDC80F
MLFLLLIRKSKRADQALAQHNLWPQLGELLRKFTVCDPACGSGSFLVGMLLVLDDLQARANARLGLKETPYERRRRIIGEQLYGVDVKDWAVHVAELRLWLQLVVETELQPSELKFRPLLPNLSFKVRCGDSLLQEIGGINFGLHRTHLNLPPI